MAMLHPIKKEFCSLPRQSLFDKQQKQTKPKQTKPKKERIELP
jgi:hypothetical protein